MKLNDLELNKVHQGYCPEAMKQLPDACIQTIITSPPYYGLREYHGVKPQKWADGTEYCLGLEPTPELYVEHLCEVFDEAWRILRDDAIAWLNIGDSFCKKKVTGYKMGDQFGVPWMAYFALRKRGWYARSDICWAKRNCMPEPVKNRPTRSHEFIFMLTKNRKYYYDYIAIKEPAVSGIDITWDGNTPEDLVEKNHEKGLTDHAASRRYPTDRSCGTPDGMRNKRSVWTISTKNPKDAHFATFNEELINPMILAGTSEHGACANCGAPYERIVEQVNPLAKTSGRGKEQSERQKDEGRLTIQRPTSITSQNIGAYETIGWNKPCTCETDEVRPCVVFDPFAGSGTTLTAAMRLGRNGIGFDASKEYVENIAKFKVESARSGLTKAEQKLGQKLLF